MEKQSNDKPSRHIKLVVRVTAESMLLVVKIFLSRSIWVCSLFALS